MDYKGQYLSERIYQLIFLIFGLVAWIYGYVQSDFYMTVKGWAISMVVALVLCIPDWPFYNRNPVTWLSDIPDRSDKTKQKNKKQK